MADDRLATIAAFWESNAGSAVPSHGHIVQSHYSHSLTDQTLTSVVHYFFESPYYLMQSRNVSDPADEECSHAIMVNEKYAAAIVRSAKSRRWELKAVAFPNEAYYETIRKGLVSSIPTRSYLYAGPSWLPEELRTGKVLSVRRITVDGKDVDEWEIAVTARDSSGSVLLDLVRDFQIETNEPYRIRQYGNPLPGAFSRQEVRLAQWSDIDGVHYPGVHTVLNAPHDRDKLVPAVTAKIEFGEAIGNHIKPMAYLSYYGLPEPGERPKRTHLVLIVLGAVGILLVLVSKGIGRRLNSSVN
jgi:hypothetical protein